MHHNEDRFLIHVADPMCSWCYAFEPELRRVREETGLPVRLVMGGLFVASQAKPLDDTLRRYLGETWPRVSERSGQPVSFELLEWNDWVYDTGPACRAGVAMRTLAPDHAMRFFEMMQHAFYADNLDVTDTGVLAELASQLGQGGQDFAELLARTDLADDDYAEARRLGAHGFPTLILSNQGDRVPVSSGYSKADQILRTISVMT